MSEERLTVNLDRLLAACAEHDKLAGETAEARKQIRERIKLWDETSRKNVEGENGQD